MVEGSSPSLGKKITKFYVGLFYIITDSDYFNSEIRYVNQMITGSAVVMLLSTVCAIISFIILLLLGFTVKYVLLLYVILMIYFYLDGKKYEDRMRVLLNESKNK